MKITGTSSIPSSKPLNFELGDEIEKRSYLLEAGKYIEVHKKFRLDPQIVDFVAGGLVEISASENEIIFASRTMTESGYLSVSDECIFVDATDLPMDYTLPNGHSLQFDGYITIPSTVCLLTASDDGSRVWVDLDNNGTIDASDATGLNAATTEIGAGWGNNGWGEGQGITQRQVTGLISPGTYKIRIQWEDGEGGHSLFLYYSEDDSSDDTEERELVPVSWLTTDEEGEVNGLIATVVNTSLREYTVEDWRVTPPAGEIVDTHLVETEIAFEDPSSESVLDIYLADAESMPGKKIKLTREDTNSNAQVILHNNNVGNKPLNEWTTRSLNRYSVRSYVSDGHYWNEFHYFNAD